jgi:hypothetical protein
MIRTFLCCVWLLCCVPTAAGQDLRAQAYLGLSIRDTGDGPVVGWIFPGPLGGQSSTSASGIRRGDNLVSVNGQAVDAAGFIAAIAAMKPGDTVTLVLRRSPQADPNAAVPTGGPGGDEFTVTSTLGSRHEWTGTVGRGAGERVFPDPPQGAFEAMILARAGEHGVLDAEGGLNALRANLRAVQEAGMDPNALDAVVNVFRRPLSIDAQEAIIDRGVRGLQELSQETDPAAWAELMRAAAGMIQVELPRPHATLDGIDFNLTRYTIVAKRLETGYAEKTLALVRHLRDNISVSGVSAGDQINVIADAGETLSLVLPATVDLFEQRTKRLAERLHTATQAVDTAPIDRATLPDVLAAAVTGDIMAFWEIGDLFGVVTASGPNQVDISVVAEVIDLGGDDQYIWPEDLPNREGGIAGNHIIIDLGGKDLYESLAECAGPGTGVFGVSLVDDRAGDDIYRSARLGSIGLGLFGIAILIDRAGNDRYENLGRNSGWSTGVGFYGVGLVIDHDGSDVHHAEKLSQGVGGPRGFGAIIDAAGNDRYEANGPNFGSAYGTPDVFLGMSQGFGFGVRSYAAGGVGAIYDDAGDDEYIAGEFSQAGGYYFGLGVLHDRAGNDRYHGNRYGQAFAAHQAAGILVDDAGDDSYWSMTAASQSGVWDQSVTMFIDRSGNDTYRADGLALGAASMQAIGVFLDLDGNDRYEAPAGATLGQSGGNSYHYEADGVFSFSAFFDRGGGEDTYPGHRANNESKPTGARHDASPKDSGLYGIFVDE